MGLGVWSGFELCLQKGALCYEALGMPRREIIDTDVIPQHGQLEYNECSEQLMLLTTTLNV